LLIIHDDFDEEMEAILSDFKKRHPDKIDYLFTDHRYNDYGHTLRNIGIQNLNTEYVLITNDDNYYCPIFLERMLDEVKRHDGDIVMCDMIHSHNMPGGRQQAPYQFFETAPRRYSVDIGCFITKSELAKKVGFRDKTYTGDATYFEDLVGSKENVKIVKINQVMFVHN
jgi:hypothetical protein